MLSDLFIETTQSVGLIREGGKKKGNTIGKPPKSHGLMMNVNFTGKKSLILEKRWQKSKTNTGIGLDCLGSITYTGCPTKNCA